MDKNKWKNVWSFKEKHAPICVLFLFGHTKPLTDELQPQYSDFRDKTRERLEIWQIKNSHIRVPEKWYTGGT